jgi:hypothetical protein
LNALGHFSPERFEREDPHSLASAQPEEHALDQRHERVQHRYEYGRLGSACKKDVL